MLWRTEVSFNFVLSEHFMSVPKIPQTYSNKICHTARIRFFTKRQISSNQPISHRPNFPKLYLCLQVDLENKIKVTKTQSSLWLVPMQFSLQSTICLENILFLVKINHYTLTLSAGSKSVNPNQFFK